MEIWNQLLNFISESLSLLSTHFNGDQAMAIIAFTVIIRLVLMPIQIKSTIQMAKNKQALAKIKPELDQIKTKYRENPKAMFNHSNELYKKHDIRMFDRYSFANLFSQGVIGIAMFQTVKNFLLHSPFAWIANIAKPDVGLALVVGMLTYVATIVTPGMAEQGNTLLVLLPAILSIVVVSTFPSALGLFWATSNLAAIMQSFIAKLLMKRKEQLATNN